MKKIYLVFIANILMLTIVNAQDNVGIGTLTPNAKALLDLTSTNKGLMVPRLSTVQRLAINPVGNADASLLVYDTNDNLFYFWNGTQWVPFPTNGNNISLNYNATTGVLQLVDNGGTLTTTIAPNTDSQTLTLNTTTNILSISGGNTVDLTPYVNTDNQDLTAATLTGTTLTISIQNGNPVSVDLSALLGTDNQTLTLAGTDLSISNGNTIDLSPFVNTDNQDLTSATLTGTNLTIEIQNGAPVTVDLSSLVGTDNQTLTLTGNNLSISNGNTIDLTQFLDNTDNQDLTSAVLTGTTLTVSIQNGNPVSVDLSSLIGTDNQNLTNATLTGNTLTIEIQNGNPVSVDLSTLIGTDNQTLTLAGNNLSISNGNTIDLTQFLDNTDNQNLTSAVLTGTTLTVSIQNGNPVSVDLSSLLGTDNQNLTNATLVGNTLTIEIQNGNPVSVDLSALVGTDNQTLTLTGNNLSISNGNTVDLSSLAGDWKLLGNAGTNPTTNFLGTTDAQDLVFRTNNVERIRTLASNGNVGINTPTPQFRFQVNGDAAVGFNNPVNTGTFPNYGNFLHLLGGPSGGTFPSDNSDPFWLARYNVASNISQLRINIGDDPTVAAVQDMLNVGTTTGATFTSRLSVLSTGNVGISTEAPKARLDIVGGADANGANDPVAMGFQWRNGGYNHFVRTRHNGTINAGGNSIDFYTNNSAVADGSSAPGVGNIHVMTVESFNSTPRVGVGTTNPQFNFQVNGDAAIGFDFPVNTGAFPAYGNRLNFLGGASGPTFSTNNSDALWIARYNTASDVSQLRINIGDNPTGANADMLNIGVTQGATFFPRLSVVSTGNVGIGNDNPQSRLHINNGVGQSFIRLDNGTTPSLNILFGNTFVGYTNNDGIVYYEVGGGETHMFGGEVIPDANGGWDLGKASNRWRAVFAVNGTIQTSDIRYKKDILKSNYGLSDVMQLNPVTYRWKDGDETVKIGFIAQDLIKIIPEVVNVGDDKDQTLGVNYADLVPVLTKAIQELNELVESQKNEINSLKTSLDSMNSTVSRLNQLEQELENLKSYIFSETKK